MYKICFYAPDNFADVVKNAMFNAGAGRLGKYSCCSWQSLGEGQFLPGEDSDAYIGTLDNLEKTPEYKVEMICADEFIHQAIAALRLAHPYEEPAFQVWRLEDF